MKKTKYILMMVTAVFIMALPSAAETLSIDKAVEIFIGGSVDTKNNVIDTKIKEINKNQIMQSANQNLSISAKTQMDSKTLKPAVETKAAYNDFYLAITPKTETNPSGTEIKYSLSAGWQKSINDYIYDASQGKLINLKIEGETEKIKYRAAINAAVEGIAQKYLNILDIMSSQKLNLEMMEKKNKDLEIAEIKYANNNISIYDVNLIKSNIIKLKKEGELLGVQYDEAVGEIKSTLGISEDFILETLGNIVEYKVARDETALKQIELQIAAAEENLKSIRNQNLPQGTANASYDITNNIASAGVSVTFYPMDYKGNEKEALLKVEKLKNNLEEEKKNIETSAVKKENEIKKQEINTEIALENLNISKKELEKYEVMYKQGNISEYDYYSKQLEAMNNELSYSKNVNSLNMLKKKQEILSKL